MTLDELFAALHRERLVDGPQAPALSSPEPSAWYVRAMLGFAGWLAGIFLVGFFGGLFAMLFRDGGAMVFAGWILCAAAFVIYRMRDGEVVSQIALAASMAGQLFFAFGVVTLTRNFDGPAAFLVGLFQVALVVAMRHWLHRFLSTVFAAGAFYYSLHEAGGAGVAIGAAILAFAFAAAWLEEPRWRASRYAGAFSAVALGLGVALTVWASPRMAREAIDLKSSSALFEGIGYGLGLLVFTWGALRHVDTRTRVLGMAGALALILAADPAPGIIAAVLVMLAAYRAGHRVLLAWSIVAIFGYLGGFYYQLDQTLLAKAGTLAISGVALLVARFILQRTVSGEPR
jgi:hypothetical protein